MEGKRYTHSAVALTQISAYVTQKNSVVRKNVQALRTLYASAENLARPLTHIYIVLL